MLGEQTWSLSPSSGRPCLSFRPVNPQARFITCCLFLPCWINRSMALVCCLVCFGTDSQKTLIKHHDSILFGIQKSIQVMHCKGWFISISDKSPRMITNWLPTQAACSRKKFISDFSSAFGFILCFAVYLIAMPISNQPIQSADYFCISFCYLLGGLATTYDLWNSRLCCSRGS